MTIKIALAPLKTPADLRREITAPGFHAELFRIGGPREVQFRHSGAAFVALNNILRSDGETLICGKRSTLKDLRRKLTCVPAQGEVTGWSKFTHPRSSYVAVFFEATFEDFDSYNLRELEAGAHFQDEHITATLLKFKDVLLGYDSFDSAYVETLGLLLLQELCKAQHPQREHHNTGGLTPTQLARIGNYIGDHIKSSISIAELATLVGISRFHFIRAFRQTVGVSPYQYVLMERANRAKDLLRRGDVKIEEVAHAVGFADPAQLGRVFRKFTGMTPTEFRKNRSLK